MEIIKLSEPYQSSQLPKEPSVLALGFFDGVHRGHGALLRTARELADERGAIAAAVTFDHHPRGVVSAHGINGNLHLLRHASICFDEGVSGPQTVLTLRR